MRFQPILNTIFSNFSGGACPRTPLEGLKIFFSPLCGSKIFFKIDFPPNKKSSIETCLTVIAQRKILRVMTFSEINAHTAPFFSQLGILKVQDVHQFQLLCFVYDCHYKLAPVHFNLILNQALRYITIIIAWPPGVIFFWEKYISVWN